MEIIPFSLMMSFGAHARTFCTVIDYRIDVAYYVGPIKFWSQRVIQPAFAGRPANKKQFARLIIPVRDNLDSTFCMVPSIGALLINIPFLSYVKAVFCKPIYCRAWLQ